MNLESNPKSVIGGQNRSVTEADLLDVFQSLREGIAYTTLKGKILFVNHALEQMMDAPASEMTGETIIKVAGKLLSAKSIPKVLPLLQSLLKGDEISPFNVEHQGRTLEVTVNVSKSTQRLTGIIRDVTERVKYENELIEREVRSRMQRSAIASLVTRQVDDENDFMQFLKNVTRLAAETTGADMSGVWFFNEDFSVLECKLLYDTSQKRHVSGGSLLVEDFPIYFNALKTNGFIKAVNAHDDQVTGELVNKGLKALGVKSMLDIGIYIKEKLAGIICQKHLNKPHEWHPDEEAFLHTMSALTSQVIANRGRKMAESELLQSEIRFKELFDFAADGILLGSPEGIILEANDAFYGMTGLNPGSVIGIPITELPFDVENLALNPFRFDLVEQGQTIQRQRIIVKPDGERVFVEMISRRLPDDHYQSHLRNITKRKIMEKALMESEEKFSKAFKFSPFLLSITRVSDGKFLDVNDAFVPMSGYSREEALESSTINLDLWESQSDRLEVVERLQQGLPVINKEYRFKTKHGTVFLGAVSCQLFNLHGEMCILSVVEDISERIEAEKELRERMDELERFYKITVGRELSMIELKKEINQLLTEAGKDPKYKTIED